MLPHAMRFGRRAFFLACLALLSGMGALPGTAEAASAASDWSVFTDWERGKKLCWVATTARNEPDSFLMISKRRGEVWPDLYFRMASRFETPTGLALVAGNRAYPVTTMIQSGQQHAWLKHRSQTDKVIVAIMAAEKAAPGGRFTLVLARGQTTVAAFSGYGFTAAYKDMLEACS